MKCLRCGYCCVFYMVVLPDGSFKNGVEECKFLEWDGDVAVCTIHGQPGTIDFEEEKIPYVWDETPCGQFEQEVGGEDDECRMGRWCRDHGLTTKKMMEERA